MHSSSNVNIHEHFGIAKQSSERKSLLPNVGRSDDQYTQLDFVYNDFTQLDSLARKYQKKNLKTTLTRPESNAKIDELSEAYMRALWYEKGLKELMEHGDPEIKNKEILTLKRYRLFILKTVEAHLNKIITNPSMPKNLLLAQAKDKSKAKESFLMFCTRRITYYILLFSGIIMDSAASFLGTQGILAYFTILSPTASLAIGLVFSFINSALFYSFDAGMLRKALHITAIDEDSQRLDLDDSEIESTRRITRKMKEPDIINLLDKESYKAFAEATAIFNEGINAKKADYQQAPAENSWLRIFRHTVTGIGCIMMLGTGYFMTSSLLAFFTASLLGTPIGWAIVGFGMISTLAYFLSMRGSAVVHMLNPALQRFDELKQKLDHFESIEKDDLTYKYKKQKEEFKVAQLYQHQQKQELRPDTPKYQGIFKDNKNKPSSFGISPELSASKSANLELEQSHQSISI